MWAGGLLTGDRCSSGRDQAIETRAAAQHRAVSGPLGHLRGPNEGQDRTQVQDPLPLLLCLQLVATDVK